MTGLQLVLLPPRRKSLTLLLLLLLNLVLAVGSTDMRRACCCSCWLLQGRLLTLLALQLLLLKLPGFLNVFVLLLCCQPCAELPASC
jgi:hypothetical protein